MATTALGHQSIFAYLNVTKKPDTFDRRRLEELRTAYEAAKKEALPSDGAADEAVLLIRVAQMFLLADDQDNIGLLSICVASTPVDVVCEELCGKYIEWLLAEKRKKRPTAPVATPPANTAVVESLSQLICRIVVKQDRPEVLEFIQTFLISPLANAGVSGRASSSQVKALSLDLFVHGPLTAGSVLDLFVRSQMRERGGTIDLGRAVTKLPLAEAITLVDEFDTWHFDHLRGLFDLQLVPTGKIFPARWKLANDAKLFYLIEKFSSSSSNDDEGCDSTTNRNVDRPGTGSLERFVSDVCEKENNGMAAKWLDALRADDLFSFDHLANLKFHEWSELKVLSMNGKKILKSYVDREKQTTSDTKAVSSQATSTASNQSESELLASLHQIKLYFHHILVKEFAASRVPRPPKLDVRCVRLSFDEMRRDGFADDGLFDEMKVFFLPLTMVENDLSIDERQWRSLANERLVERNQLEQKKLKLIEELSIIEDEYYRHDESMGKLRREKAQLRRQQSDNATGHDGTKYESYSVAQLLQEHRREMEQLEPVRTELRTRIRAMDDLLDTIEMGLIDKDSGGLNSRADRDLIKPNRGFIMYGPPGTGKSDIMSKLCTRIGVSMVAPPIAAGELNRPLVGESERIISDICMRCHRTPYLMCCVSIDEIDSLAPKRTDDSSDGNVAKLSVLLSVIDGIKDVPNLMIFCATNRLHMMDEAFLRRMSGKFFVGRPSSQARKSILSGIKMWHLNPQLLENLTMATTNFSGAALRALRRLITVHCVDNERTNPRYRLDYRTALQLTDKTARQYRILIGAQTLPTLLLRSVDESHDDKRQEFAELPSKRNSRYTGKILVNFHARRIDVEAVQTNSGTDKPEKVVYQEHLRDSETDLQALLERLTAYGKSRNVQLLQLIDLNLLSAESAYDEKEKFEILKERLDECFAYRRSMIVYDLDSLVGVNRSEGNSSMGRSTNLALINQNVYTYVKDKFQQAHIQQKKQLSTTTSINTFEILDDNHDDNEEKWAVMVIRDPFLLRQFCSDIDFTRPASEVEQDEADMRRAEELFKCVQCNDFYLEQDNKMGVCMHHDGFVYDNSTPTLQQWGQHAAVQQLLNEEARQPPTASMTPEEKENVERAKVRFKYICCNQTVLAGQTMCGCKKGKHSAPNVTLIEWEHACDHHREYRDKRLALLESRLMHV